jgi:virginiamycin B lyase
VLHATPARSLGLVLLLPALLLTGLTFLACTTRAQAAPAGASAAAPARLETKEFPVPRGSGPHDVAPAVDGGVWYTAQLAGALGWLNPATGETRHIALARAGERSAPHGVIVGPDGAPWVTDGGLNAIVRVDPATSTVQRFPLPPERASADLNTATFDRSGSLWFTGQRGIYGRLNPADGSMEVWSAPRGAGPYGITTTPGGDVYFVSLANNYLARIDLETGEATPIDPPTPRQGTRRVWSDAEGRLWVSEWNVGQLGLYDPSSGAWREWKLPGNSPQTYAVYVAEDGAIWMTDHGANAMVRFDPSSETFEVLQHATPYATVRQLHGRPGEVWGAESAQDRLVVVYTR